MQNLLAFSSRFAVAGWTTVGGAVVVEQGPDPAGGTTGGYIAACALAQGLYLGAAVAAPRTLSAGVWVRAPNATGASPFIVGVSDAFGSTGGAAADVFYSIDGVIGAISTHSITDGNWHFVTFTQPTTIAGQLGIYIRNGGGATQRLEWAWPRLSYGRTPSEYVETIGGAFNAGLSGARGIAIGRVAAASPANLFTSPKDLSAAAWVKTGVTVASTEPSPLGGLADSFVETAAVSEHYALQSVVAMTANMREGEALTISAYVKAAGRSAVNLVSSNGSHYAAFDLLTGAFIVAASSPLVTSGYGLWGHWIAPLDQAAWPGWYRIAMSAPYYQGNLIFNGFGARSSTAGPAFSPYAGTLGLVALHFAGVQFSPGFGLRDFASNGAASVVPARLPRGMVRGTRPAAAGRVLNT